MHFSKGNSTKNLFKSSDFWLKIVFLRNRQKVIFWPKIFLTRVNKYFWTEITKNLPKPSKYMCLGKFSLDTQKYLPSVFLSDGAIMNQIVDATSHTYFKTPIMEFNSTIDQNTIFCTF